MTDDQLIAGAPPDPATRMRSDVARMVDLEALEGRVMAAITENTRAVAGVGGRVDNIRDELSGFVISHSQLHADFATDWAERWTGITAELAYRRGLIGLPRLVLEWLRQYMPTLMKLGALIAAIVGFATGAVNVDVGQ